MLYAYAIFALQSECTSLVIYVTTACSPAWAVHYLELLVQLVVEENRSHMRGAHKRSNFLTAPFFSPCSR